MWEWEHKGGEKLVGERERVHLWCVHRKERVRERRRRQSEREREGKERESWERGEAKSVGAGQLPEWKWKDNFSPRSPTTYHPHTQCLSFSQRKPLRGDSKALLKLVSLWAVSQKVRVLPTFSPSFSHAHYEWLLWLANLIRG